MIRTFKQWPPVSSLHPYHIRLVLLFNPNPTEQVIEELITMIVTAVGLAFA